MNILYPTPDNPLFHTGPLLDHGPLPSLFYFSLSGSDSLTLDPYNQPVQFLRGQMIRVFSLTLPGHETGLPASGAMTIWAEDCAKGKNPIAEFLDKAQEAIEFAIRERFIDPNKMAVGGLSRGGFAAAHLAAREPRFSHILGFAPLTKLSAIKEFAQLQHNSMAESLDLTHLAPHLNNRSTRLFIGNCDTRVGTKHCVDFGLSLVSDARKPPDVEISITKSIGQMGHGTAPEIFSKGALWIQTALS